MPSHRRLFALRCAAWLCVALIAVLSLVPRSLEVRTYQLLDTGHTVTSSAVRDTVEAGEHVLAYWGTTGLLALAYSIRPIWMISGILCAYSGLLEILQTFSPGRHPGLDGMLWSSTGVLIAGSSVSWLRSRRALKNGRATVGSTCRHRDGTGAG